MIDRVGQQFGNYRLIRSLGSGGFADVYLGQHVYLNTYSAIKILQTRLAQNDSQVFLTEARTIANLTHRHIVQVLDFGVEQNQNTPFLVMAYAPNGTLRQRHPSGSRLSLSEVVSYISQVATALQYAHDRKVIHRDIKPENMLVGQNSDILLSDFGIAVVSQSSRYSGQEVTGTAAYMAPEQTQGRAVLASDQYALAVVAYEWLTGERPFKGSPIEIIGQHLSAAPPPLRHKVASLPSSVEQIIQTALNKNPQQRFQSVRAFASALTQASEGSQKFDPLMSDVIQGSEAQISTHVKQPANQGQPSLRTIPSGNYPEYNTFQQGNSFVPPSPGFTTHEGDTSLHTPRFTQPGVVSGQFTQQVLPTAPMQEKRPGSNRGLMVAVILLVILLVAVTSAGTTYFFVSRQAPASTPGGQTQPTATSPQTGASTAPSSVPTTTPTTQATPTPTSTTTLVWGPGTKNQKLVCIQNCDINHGTFDITLTSIVTTNSAMAWNFTIMDNGDVCTGFFGERKLVDPAGNSVNADGGTFTRFSTINTGQMLPKTATFSELPTSGMLYEVDIKAGCSTVNRGIYKPEQFQR